MKAVSRAAVFAMIWVCIAGCGGHSNPSSPPVSDACTGVAIKGVMQDSLTFQPVYHGVAVLETGTQIPVVPLVNFSPAQQVATDAEGAFNLCAQSVTSPSLILLEAFDSTGKVYPPFVAPVSGVTDLGTVPMGGCTVVCGFEGSEQTAAPATITGVITSEPVGITGSVLPQFPLEALDGSKTQGGLTVLWQLAMPIFDSSQSFTFNTTAGTCSEAAPFCANYTLGVPSQSPVERVSGGTIQLAVTPIYLISVAPKGSVSCSPIFGETIYQQDGKSFLTGNPGAQITAKEIDFTNCQ